MPPAATTEGDEALQPKLFVWGILMNVAFKVAMQLFSSWMADKVTNNLTGNSLSRILLNSANSVVVSVKDDMPFAMKSMGAEENTIVGKATKPLKLENGRENYQGLHVAMVAFDQNLNPAGLRPVGSGFKTGERIKLKVLPTFDAFLVIENINPKGERVQIFPAKPTDALAIKAGLEILVPPAKDDFFEFAGVTGEEQLVITVRDKRAFGDAASKLEVSRKDDEYGSSFVQEVTEKTYPVIAQSIKLQHSK